MKIAVIGAGSWGTTLAVILGEKGYDTRLWARREELAKEINDKKENKEYLPNVKIPNSVIATSSLKDAIENTDIIFISVPSIYLRDTLKKIKPFYKSQIVVSTTKGFEVSGKRMSQIIEEELQTVKVAVLSGPNHAEEVSMKMPTASIVACKNLKTGKIICDVLQTQYFKLYELDDVIGTEICAALKNIAALATGACDGLGFGDNSKAAIITLSLMEMNNFGRHFGAKRGTVYGLAGVGDLVATCMSRHSRNRKVGEQLAKGKTMEEIKKEMKGMVAEGISATKSVYEYSKKHNIEMPLTQQAYEVIFQNKNMMKALKDLLRIV
ncbi:MAG: NAD(P)H-dependent glycerol-3-phosphate dehydrogenase [Nanoarchaeota archaeon]